MRDNCGDFGVMGNVRSKSLDGPFLSPMLNLCDRNCGTVFHSRICTLTLFEFCIVVIAEATDFPARQFPSAELIFFVERKVLAL